MSVVISGTDGITLPDNGSLSTSIGDAISITSGYVSGIQLGGTAAANTLDSYEEGTWVPTGGVVPTINYARYTKIGRFIQLNLDMTSGSSSSGSGWQFNLPFTPSDGYYGGSISYLATSSFQDSRIMIASGNLEIRSSQNGGALTYANLSGVRIIATLTYTAVS
jgi:hypothetical protein